MTPIELDRSRLPADVCEHLCTKTMFTGGEDRRRTEDAPIQGFSTAHYWCVFTQRPWGEDGDEVGPNDCRPGRACCKPRLVPPEV